MSQRCLSSSAPVRPRWRLNLLRVACLAAPLLLGACATSDAHLAAAEPALLDDADFAPSTEPIDPADVFKVTPEMQAYIDNEILPASRARGLRSGLTDALY